MSGKRCGQQGQTGRAHEEGKKYEDSLALFHNWLVLGQGDRSDQVDVDSKLMHMATVDTNRSPSKASQYCGPLAVRPRDQLE